MLTNPHQLKVASYRHQLPNHPKTYHPFVGRITRFKSFKTATQALEYAMRLQQRWCRLYQAAILAMTETPK